VLTAAVAGAGCRSRPRHTLPLSSRSIVRTRRHSNILLIVVAIVMAMMPAVPFPFIVITPVPMAIDAFPAPIVVFLIPSPTISAVPAVVILVWIHAAMMLRKSVTCIHAGSAVIAYAAIGLRIAPCRS